MIINITEKSELGKHQQEYDFSQMLNSLPDPLKKEEELELGKLPVGHPERWKLVEHNIKGVVKYANKRYGQSNSSRLDYAELYGAGLDALVECMDKYTHTKNAKFFTYASWYIRRNVDHAFYRGCYVVNVPRYGIPEEMEQVIEVGGGLHADEWNVGDEGGTARKIEKNAETQDTMKRFMELLKIRYILTPIELEVVLMRTGLPNNEQMKYREIAEVFDWSPQNARRVFIGATEKLKKLV